jgi:hypothetical protein
MATELQIRVLKSLRFNDFGTFNGAKTLPTDFTFNPDDWAVWSDCINCSLVPGVPTGKALGALVSTLKQAGLVWSDSECVGLTKAGFDLVEAETAKETV